VRTFRSAIELIVAGSLLVHPALADDSSLVGRVSIEGSLGVGIGHVQGDSAPAGRVGLDAAYWLTPRIGVGLQGTLLAQAQILVGATSGTLIGPAASLLFPTYGGYWTFTGAVGYAHLSYDYTSLCLFDECGPPPKGYDLPGGFTSLHVGYIHDSTINVGAFIAYDLAAPFQGPPNDALGLFTFNFVLGYGL
jgi:hypothetical protein